MEYGVVIWNKCYDCDSALLDSVQYEAARRQEPLKVPVLKGYTRNSLGSLLVAEGNCTLEIILQNR